MILDPASPVGMIRLRIGDWSDLPILSDSVIQSALAQSDGNVPRAALLSAQFVLASLTSKTFRKMGLQLEVHGQEWYQNYRDFLMLTISNPAFMPYSPIPLESLTQDNRNLLQEFVSDWNRNYYRGGERQQLALSADIGPNDGSRYGPMGSLSTNTNTGNSYPGWTVA